MMDETKRWQQKKARENFSYFNNLFDYPPPVYPPAPMHQEWEDVLERAYGLYHKVLLLAPRGAAKSERVTINYPSWMIGKYHDLRISIVSETSLKAESFLNKITLRVEEDPHYRDVFGNLKPLNPAVWRKDAITVKRRIISKDPSISAIGAKGQAVSKRADIIILDDPLNDENTRTDFQRKSMIDWCSNSLDPTLEPSGLFVAIMTPWHEDDLSQYLMKQQGWIVMKYPVVKEENFDKWLETDDKALTVWPDKYGYEVTVVDHNGKPILDETGNPQIISFLRGKYNANIDTFMSQYMLNPFSITGTLFNEDWIKYFSNEEWVMAKPNCLIYQGWDLAIKLDERADYTCCATVAHDLSLNTIYVLDVARMKVTPLQQFEAVIQQYRRWSPVCPVQQVTIESDHYQEALAMGLVVSTTLPIVESKSRGKRKLDRIGLLAPHFRNGRFRLGEHLRGGEFVYEYKRFPKGAHDDQLDALQKAVEPVLGQAGGGPMVLESLDLRGGNVLRGTNM